MPTIENNDMDLRFGDVVRKRLRRDGFWKDEDGQDLIEYSLLLAFVCLSGAAMFIGMGRTTSGLWSIVNSRLAAANQSN